MGSARTVAEKMGIKAGWRAHFANAPDDVVAKLGLPRIEIIEHLGGQVDYIHLFVTTQTQMRSEFPDLVTHLGMGGKLWVSWPKGRALGSDLSLPTVIKIGYDCGLVESTCLRIDETWAGLRFTHPKQGKTYRNSYGTLPDA